MHIHISDIPTGNDVLDSEARLCHPESTPAQWRAGSQLHHMRRLLCEIRDQLNCLRQSDGYKRRFSDLDSFTVGEWMDTRLSHFNEMLDKVAESDG